MPRSLFLLPLLAACSTASAPSLADDVDWLLGTWASGDRGLSTMERWTALPNGDVLGSGIARQGPAVAATETMALVDGEDGRFFVTWPQGQEAVVYRIERADDEALEVVRAAPEFPARITYARPQDRKLRVTASGTREGAPVDETWTLDRVDAPRKQEDPRP